MSKSWLELKVGKAEDSFRDLIYRMKSGNFEYIMVHI